MAEIPKTDKVFTWDEIMKHTSEADCWLVLRSEGTNYVANMTDWLKDHPGGMDPIQQMAGKDATNMFFAVHTQHQMVRADKEWKKRVIGTLDPNSKRPEAEAKPMKYQKPIRYGIQMNPMYFWLLVLVAFIAIIWAAVAFQ